MTDRRLVIMANGGSLADHDLSRIDCDVLGLNRSYKLYWPTVHVVIEPQFSEKDQVSFAKMAKQGILYSVGARHSIAGKNLMARYAREPAMPCWSWAPGKDGVFIGRNGVGSVSYAALQIAYWLGYRTIAFLGLDLGGARFDGSWPDQSEMEKQNALMIQAQASLAYRRDCTVINVGSPDSRCTAFPLVTFDEAFPLRSEKEPAQDQGTRDVEAEASAEHEAE